MGASEVPPRGGTVVLGCPFQLLSAGLTQSLVSSGWQVLGAGVTGRAVLELVDVHRPDICLVLVPFPEGAAELVSALTALKQRPRVVCLSSDVDMADHTTVRQVFASGADGWLTLDLEPEVLGRTLEGVRAGEAAVSRRHVRLLLGELRPVRPDLVRRVHGDEVVLSPRQQQVLAALVRQSSTRDIAETLGISTATVRWHTAELLRKFEVRTRGELLAQLGPRAASA